MKIEKQHYSKVKTRIEGMARIASSVLSPLLFRNSEAFNQVHASTEITDSKIPEDLKSSLSEINRKLDLLLQLHSIKKLEDSYPIKLEIKEISGEGIRFKPNSDISENEILEVVLILEQVPLKLAGAKGIATKTKSDNIWFLNFKNIRENDQESIIQFVFSEQRELIRSNKLS